MAKPKIQGFEMHALMLVGCSGFYSPSRTSPLGNDFPIDLYSGEIERDVWARWTALSGLRGGSMASEFILPLATSALKGTRKGK